MCPFVEPLESRTLFSFTPLGPAPAPALPTAHADIVALAVAKLPKLRGTWKGAILVSGVHTQPITLTITTQTHTGRLTGTLVANADNSVQVAFTGRVKANRTITVALSGSHSGGTISGTGTGRVSRTGHTITVAMTFIQSGQTFAGTLTLSNA